MDVRNAIKKASLGNSSSIFVFVLRSLLSTLVYRRKNSRELVGSAAASVVWHHHCCMQLHLSFGITIAAVVALRIIWRNLNQTPIQEPGTKRAHLATQLGHYALYAVMILMPLTGYIGTGVNTEFFNLFDLPKFEATSLYQMLVTDWMELSFEEFEEPIDFVHKKIMGKWFVWILILGHVMAAIYHHMVKKDRTLIKMTTG